MHHANFAVQCLVSYPLRDRVGAIGFEYHIRYRPQPHPAEPKPPVIRLMRPGLQPMTGNVMSELVHAVVGFVVCGLWCPDVDCLSHCASWRSLAHIPAGTGAHLTDLLQVTSTTAV